MKKLFKRSLALCLALAMMLSTAACSGGDENNVQDGDSGNSESVSESVGESQNEEQQGTVDDAAAGDYELGHWVFAEDPEAVTGEVRFYIPFKGDQGMDDMIAEFNETYPNVSIELNTYSNGSEGNVAVNAAIMAGEVDVLASFGLNQTYKRWEGGMFLPLTDYIEQYGIDILQEWGSDKYIYDGVYYTFPCGGLGNYIAINMTDWNNAGLGELPTEWTWDEYLDACRKMTQVNSNGEVEVYGGSDYSSINYYTYPWYQVYGHDQYYAEDGTASNFSDPLIVNALQREINAEQVEKIWYPLTTYRADGSSAAGVFLQHYTSSVIVCNLLRFLRDQETYPVDWITGFAPYPVEEKGQTNYMEGIPIYSHAGICTGVQNEEAAWYWLAWYSTYGVKYLVNAGHASAWKGTDPSSIVDLVFGSREEAEKLVDLESFERVVTNYDAEAYIDTYLWAYSDLASICNEYGMYAHQGTMSVEEAMAAAQQEADKLIQEAME